MNPLKLKKEEKFALIEAESIEEGLKMVLVKAEEWGLSDDDEVDLELVV